MYEPNTLRQARLAAGLKYREVAEAAQVDPSTICAYESRHSNPSVAALDRWENALAVLLGKRRQEIDEALSSFVKSRALYGAVEAPVEPAELNTNAD